MSKKGLSRREFLRIAGAAGAGAALGSKIFGMPAVIKAQGEFDLSDPAQVGKALQAEGAEVMIKSWGFSGLTDAVFTPQFADYTKKLYGVPVKLSWYTGDFDKDMTNLPLAGKTPVDIGIDVIDKEEDSHAKLLALEWTEPINLPKYMPLLTLLKDVEDPYVLHTPDQAVDGADIHGLIYQGYEWLQAIIRKDKVDVSNYKDWTDLSRDEMKKKGIDYGFNDNRGNFVFMGILNSLIKQGTVKGDLWSQDAWTAGIKWWKDHLEDKLLVVGDIGNDPTMRLKLQSGEAWWGGLWGSYTRELLAIDWNKKDDVLWPFYPASGIAADREVLRVAKGCKHPVAARILINWFVTTEFQNVGWYKEKPGADATNRWNVTEDKYLVAYCGGVMKANRDAMPDWAKPFYPEDPGKLILPINWEWYTPQVKWISDTYDQIVHGS